MYSGKDLWKNLVAFDLHEVRASENRIIETYKDLPVNLYEALRISASKYPDKIALCDDEGGSVNYRELLREVERVSALLYTRFALREGDRVGLLLYNGLAFCVLFLALNRIGAVSIPLPTKFTRPEVLSLLDKSDVSAVFFAPSFADWFAGRSSEGVRFVSVDALRILAPCGREAEADCPDAAFPPARPAAAALLVFTSGTTSQSKGALIRNYNIMHAIKSYQLTLQLSERDVSVIPIPLYLITGLIAVFGLFVFMGATVHLQKYFDAGRVLECVQRQGVTFLHASPTVFSMLLRESQRFPELPTFRKLACGGSNMPKEKIRQIHAWLPASSFHTVYGLTETTSPATVFPSDAAVSPHIGSSGLPIPGVEFRILREDGSEAAPGESGAVWLRGTNIIESYYKIETALIRDGWLDTGDIGYFDGEGYLYICDRRKDVINRGGEKITSFDVENELYKIPGIREAAVVGIPDEIYGEVPAAVVTVEPGLAPDPDAIGAALRSRLAKYKVPGVIRVMESIPLTPNGKIDKKRIRALLADKRLI